MVTRLERQILLDRHRLTQQPTVFELLAIRRRAIRALRLELRSERNRDRRKWIEDALLERKRQWRKVQELARAQLSRKMKEGRLYFFEEGRMH